MFNRPSPSLKMFRMVAFYSVFYLSVFVVCSWQITTAIEDSKHNEQLEKTGDATSENAFLPTSADANRLNADSESGETSDLHGTTQPPGTAESQEQKPPSRLSAEMNVEDEEVDDLRAAIARDNAAHSESDHDKQQAVVSSARPSAAERERIKRSREASEELAWWYFLGTHDIVQDIIKAREMFTSLAEQGSAAGQFGLGVMYATGIGMNVSQPKALLYYTQAAWGDYPFAWMALGFRYFSSYAVDYNCDMAALYYHSVASYVVDGMDFLGGQTVARVRLSEDTEESSQVLDTEFVQYYQYLADKGEAAAQLALGLLYLQGKHGVEQDLELAFDYLTQASDNHNAQADAYLGKMYLKGTDATPQDFEKAYEHFQRSAAKDSPMGMVGLGLLYSLGFHVDVDQNRAKTLFTKAAEQGNAEGQLQLGNFFFRNQAPSSLAQMLSSVKNMKQAVKYWNLASQQGNALAYYNLGISHVYGHGTPRMCRIGTEFLKIVSERGKHAQYFTSAYEDYRNDNIDSALVKYALLAELGYETAHANLAFLYERKISLRVRMPLLFTTRAAPVPKNMTTTVTDVYEYTSTRSKSDKIFFINSHIPLPEDDAMRRAFFYWSQAAELGHSSARIRLGDYYFYGTGTTVNYAEALQQYRSAADSHHNAQAMFNLGYMHEKGLGSKKDLYMAKRYYDMAIDTTSDAYLPCQLALSKLNILFMWQQMRESDWYSVIPNFEAWFGENWDLLLILVSSLLFAASWLYVQYFNNASLNRRTQAASTAAVRPTAASTASSVATNSRSSQPSRAATTATSSAPVPVAVDTVRNSNSTAVAGSRKTDNVGNDAEKMLSHATRPSHAESPVAASSSSTASSVFMQPSPTATLPSNIAVDSFNNTRNNDSVETTAIAGSGSSSHSDRQWKKKNSDDDDDELGEALASPVRPDMAGGGSSRSGSNSGGAYRRRSINRSDIETNGDAGSEVTSDSDKKTKSEAGWPSE